MTAFYKCFKRTDELNNEDKPYYRAIQFNWNLYKKISKLTSGESEKLIGPEMVDGEWIVEHPFDKDENGNIVYDVYTDEGFKMVFTPSDPGPGILNGGLCVSKTKTV